MVTAQTLCATGILILYAVTFACRSYYHFAFFGWVPTFLLMTLITAVAFLLAVRLNAIMVAILGIAGGFLTPILLSTGQDNPFGLFGYIALLDIGLLNGSAPETMERASHSRRSWDRANANRVGDTILSARGILPCQQGARADGNLPRFRTSFLRCSEHNETRIEIGRRVRGRGYRNGRCRDTLGLLFPVVSNFWESACVVVELHFPRGYRSAGNCHRKGKAGRPKRADWSGRFHISCDLDCVVSHDTKSLRCARGIFRFRVAALSCAAGAASIS